MNKLLAAFNYVKARLSEPSTMTALAVISALAGSQINVEVIQNTLYVGTLIFGTLGFFFKETQTPV